MKKLRSARYFCQRAWFGCHFRFVKRGADLSLRKESAEILIMIYIPGDLLGQAALLGGITFYRVFRDSKNMN
jgi:hypothetical protein